MKGFEGYEAFFADNYVGVVRTLWSYGGDRGVAEEAAQEAFVRASRDWRRVQQLRSPVAWVHRVGINEVNRHFRRRNALWRAISRHGADDLQPPVDVAGSVSLHAALRSLPDRQRAALVLHYFADLPIVSIAEVLDVRPGTVKSLLSRGRDAVGATLQHAEEATDVH
ncbi:MAG: sigma-70 family RNA polymerase sigma factor [Nitriliruptoraceae bacterium]|nr:sigma-70 family RNA polymerase sigma factor [Nitriliruptoraceae bacterium]